MTASETRPLRPPSERPHSRLPSDVLNASTESGGASTIKAAAVMAIGAIALRGSGTRQR